MATDFGAGIGDQIIDGRFWSQISEQARRQSGLLANQIEPANDGGFGAATAAGDLGGAEAFDAVKAEYFRKRGRRAAASGIELFKQREGEEGNARRWRLDTAWRRSGVTASFELIKTSFNHDGSLAPPRMGSFLVEGGLY